MPDGRRSFQPSVARRQARASWRQQAVVALAVRILLANAGGA